MKTLEQVEADVRLLPPHKQAELRDWLENLLEDRLELRKKFKAEIKAGKQDLAKSRHRVLKGC